MSDTKEFNIGDHVKVEGWGGIAFYIHKWAKTTTPLTDEESGEIYDYEVEDDPEHVICVMVGDDREHVFHRDELAVIDEDDYCGGCGQIGCKAYG